MMRSMSCWVVPCVTCACQVPTKLVGLNNAAFLGPAWISEVARRVCVSVTGAGEAMVSVWASRPVIVGELEAEVEAIGAADGGRVAVKDAPYRVAAVLPNWVTDSPSCFCWVEETITVTNASLCMKVNRDRVGEESILTAPSPRPGMRWLSRRRRSLLNHVRRSFPGVSSSWIVTAFPSLCRALKIQVVELAGVPS